MDARAAEIKSSNTYASVGDLARYILENIETVSHANASDVFVRVESRLSIERLTALLQPLRTITLQPTAESLKTLQNFLAQRWDNIKKTDAIYSRQPNSQINQICLLLAIQLAVYLKKHPFELLMPTAVNFMDYFPHRTSDSLRLNEFIMRDNDTPLAVIDAFALIEREAAMLTNADRFQHLGSALSMNEERLLSKHSVAATTYYNSLRTRSVSSEVRSEHRQRLVDWMSSAGQSAEPQFTYDVTGKKKLATLVLSYVGDRKKLVALFAHAIPIAEWKVFLALISDNDYFKYMGGVDVKRVSLTETDREFNERYFKQVEQALTLLLSSPIHRASLELGDILVVVEEVERKKAALRSYAYCLLQFYRRVRCLQPETKSYAGYYAASFFSAYICSKEEKIAACDAVERILTESTSFKEIVRRLESDELRLHHKAIQEGMLGNYLSIVKSTMERACALEDPARKNDWVRTVI